MRWIFQREKALSLDDKRGLSMEDEIQTDQNPTQSEQVLDTTTIGGRVATTPAIGVISDAGAGSPPIAKVVAAQQATPVEVQQRVTDVQQATQVEVKQRVIAVQPAIPVEVQQRVTDAQQATQVEVQQVAQINGVTLDRAMSLIATNEAIIKDLRTENANRRRTQRDAETGKQEAERIAAEKINAIEVRATERIAEAERIATEASLRASSAEIKLAKTELEFYKAKIAGELRLPPGFAERIVGSTEAELREDAKKILALLPQPSLNADGAAGGNGRPNPPKVNDIEAKRQKVERGGYSHF